MGIFNRVMLLLITFLFFFSLFLVSSGFISPFVLPKWCFSWYPVAGGFLFLGVFKLLNRKTLSVVENSFITKVYGIISIFCFILGLYGIIGYVGGLPDFRFLHKDAGFDNPAGLAACLCAGLPLGLYFLKVEKKGIKYGAIGIVILMILAIGFTKSRTGIFTLFPIGLVGLWQSGKIKFNIKWSLLLGCCILGIAVGLYFMNAASANGRILIWICTLSMIATKPVFGFGRGGFRREYMNYQAEFFKNHAESNWASLAGNTHHVFNEYLHLMVNFGLITLIIVLILLCLLVKWYLKHRNIVADIAFLVLVAIGSFSLFSYPFRYPFIWIMSLLSILIILKDVKLKKPSHWGVKVVFASIIVATLLGTYYFTKQIKARMFWHKTTTLDLQKDRALIYRNYQTLWPKLKNNYLFLYNVSATLNRMKDYKKSLRVAKRAAQKCVDYNLQLIMADDYFKTNKYKEALKHYTIAGNMCPVRFFPLYRSFKIYKILEEKEKVESFAQKIADKPVKIKSSIVGRMKNKVENYLKKSK